MVRCVDGLNNSSFAREDIVCAPNGNLTTAALCLNAINNYTELRCANMTVFGTYTNSGYCNDYCAPEAERNSWGDWVQTNIPLQHSRSCKNIIPGYSEGEFRQMGLLIAELNGKVAGTEYKVNALGGNILKLTCYSPRSDIMFGTAHAIWVALKSAGWDCSTSDDYSYWPIATTNITGTNKIYLLSERAESISTTNKLYTLYVMYDNIAIWASNIIRTANEL